jgi:hypothetical protein
MRYVPPKRRFTYGLHGAVFQKVATLINTFVTTIVSVYRYPATSLTTLQIFLNILCTILKESDVWNYVIISPSSSPLVKSLDSVTARFLVLLPVDRYKWMFNRFLKHNHKKIKLHGLSLRANYTDRTTAACRRSDCQLFYGWRVSRGQRDGSLRPYSRFSRHEPLLFYQVAPQLYSRGWVHPVPHPLLFTFMVVAGNRTRASG